MSTPLAGSFAQYVAAIVELNRPRLERVRRAVRRAVHVPADPRGEERWDGEGGNFQSASARRGDIFR
jgi:hypothetical protein